MLSGYGPDILIVTPVKYSLTDQGLRSSESARIVMGNDHDSPIVLEIL